jgi:hypothetical protein
MKTPRFGLSALLTSMLVGTAAHGALVTDPNDARNWQGATVGTFAQLYYGSDTLANRQLVIANGLLDDGVFTFANATPATLMQNATTNGSVSTGFSTDLTGTGSYSYGLGGNTFTAANSIDNLWIQTSNVVGQFVWDLGAASTKAAIFNTIDHGPLPQESIESTVYLSNDLTNWTQAVVEKVWLEGFMTNTGILWDGFTYAVGTGTNNTFRYASIIHGGPGSLIQDGDNEINGVVGLNSNFTPSTVPDVGTTFGLLALACGAMSSFRRRFGHL